MEQWNAAHTRWKLELKPGEHIGRLARMSVWDTEVDGTNPGSSMLFP